eukprot:5686447-Amphidinium_carterae.2
MSEVVSVLCGCFYYYMEVDLCASSSACASHGSTHETLCCHSVTWNPFLEEVKFEGIVNRVCRVETYSYPSASLACFCALSSPVVE